MKYSNVVFCVECKSMKSKDSAHKVFKTGFYKTTMPLGHCKDCACESKEIEIDMVAVSGQGYLDNSVTSALF